MIISSFQRTKFSKQKSGGNSAVDTPVPIPNTEVKHCSGENTEREDSELPGFFYSIKRINII